MSRQKAQVAGAKTLDIAHANKFVVVFTAADIEVVNVSYIFGHMWRILEN